ATSTFSLQSFGTLPSLHSFPTTTLFRSVCASPYRSHAWASACCWRLVGAAPRRRGRPLPSPSGYPSRLAATSRVTERHSCRATRSEEHTSELHSPCNLVCRLLLEKKN